MDRTRTFTWNDPTPLWHRAAGLSGLELLQLMIDSQAMPPPMAQLMDIKLVEVARGRAVFHGLPQEFHYNPLGSVHGGFGATLLDSAMGCSVHTTLAPGDIYTTLEFKINYLRPMTIETGLVRGIGTVLSSTRTTALAEGRIEDASGQLYAFATTTCAIRRAGTAEQRPGPPQL